DVGLDDQADAHTAPGRRGDDPVDVARRVHHHGRVRAARQISAVAEPRHLDRVDEEHVLLLPVGKYPRGYLVPTVARTPGGIPAGPSVPPPGFPAATHGCPGGPCDGPPGHPGTAASCRPAGRTVGRSDGRTGVATSTSGSPPRRAPCARPLRSPPSRRPSRRA